ncbi:MAG: hypothetical protein IPM34_04795 [Saprospiraceae bacterium]|nr:hypothetical protein [Saprospiraceae bacterium]
MLEARPLTIFEIFKQLKKLYPEYEIRKASVEKYLFHNKILFSWFNNDKKIGLKSKEYTKLQMPKLPIYKYVEEYLSKFNEPKHVSEIANYVMRCRLDTTENSIINYLYGYYQMNSDKINLIYHGSRYWSLKRNEKSKQATPH